MSRRVDEEPQGFSRIPISRGKFIGAGLTALGLGAVVEVISKSRRATAAPNLDKRLVVPIVLGKDVEFTGQSVPLNGTPTPEPTRTTTPTRTPTPEPSPTPQSWEWPQDLLQKMSKLSVVDRLRLVRYFTPEEAQKGCGGADACYSAETREVRFFRGAPYGGELFTLAHERTHAHQHRVILDAGLGEPSDSDPTRKQLWLQTAEGKAFTSAVNAVLEDNRANGTPLPWEGFGSNLTEDGANISATWYTNPDYVEAQWPRWPALRQFAETWLPK